MPAYCVWKLISVYSVLKLISVYNAFKLDVGKGMMLSCCKDLSIPIFFIYYVGIALKIVKLGEEKNGSRITWI